MTTFTPYIALISPAGIQVREAYGWAPLNDGEQLTLPDGYIVRHETDADTAAHVNGWGWGLALMAMFLAGSVLAAVWQLGAHH